GTLVLSERARREHLERAVAQVAEEAYGGAARGRFVRVMLETAYWWWHFELEDHARAMALMAASLADEGRPAHKCPLVQAAVVTTLLEEAEDAGDRALFNALLPLLPGDEDVARWQATESRLLIPRSGAGQEAASPSGSQARAGAEERPGPRPSAPRCPAPRTAPARKRRPPASPAPVRAPGRRPLPHRARKRAKGRKNPPPPREPEPAPPGRANPPARRRKPQVRGGARGACTFPGRDAGVTGPRRSLSPFPPGSPRPPAGRTRRPAAGSRRSGAAQGGPVHSPVVTPESPVRGGVCLPFPPVVRGQAEALPHRPLVPVGQGELDRVQQAPPARRPRE